MKGRKMNNFCNDVSKILKKSHYELTEKMIRQFENYTNLLIEWNKKMNLTAILEPNEIAVKHFLDSLLVLDSYEIPKNAKVIDRNWCGFSWNSFKDSSTRHKFNIIG